MLTRDYLASAPCGVCWHGVVSLVVCTRLTNLGQLLLHPGSLAGALAGVIAGALTIRSRRRRSGREQWLVLCLAYLAAVALYAVVCATLESFTSGANSIFELLLLWLCYSFYVALVYAVFLMPLSFLTRRLVWAIHQAGIARQEVVPGGASRCR